MDTLLFLLGFLAAFTGYLLHTVLHYTVYHGRQERLTPRVEAGATVVIFAGYAGWGLMLATDPVPLGVPAPVALLGGIAGIAGVVLFLLAIRAIHGFEGTGELLTTGVFAKFRHPMYLGIILMHLGFPLLFETALTLLSAVLWIPQVVLWAKWEEEDLEKQFGEAYRVYRKQTLF